MSRRANAMRTRGITTLMLALAVATAACGLGDRAEHASRIHEARAKAEQKRTVAGVLTLTVTPDREGPEPADDAPEGIAALASGAVAPPVTRAANVQLRLEDHLAQIAIVPAAPDAAGTPPAPSTLFRGGTILVKRSNLRPTERRTWAKLDVRRLPDDEPRLPKDQLAGEVAALTALTSLNPEHVLDLVGGALPGSVRRVGREDVAGVATTHYKANVSIDRALEQLDLSEDDEEARRLVLRLLLGSNPDVRPGEFWIDDEGLLRRSHITFRQRVTRTDANDLLLALELPQYGAEIEITAPTDDETVQVERYGRLMRASLPADA